MNLTVKARVILGFFTISVLLLIISGVSLVNLRSLQHDVGEVNTVAVPTVIGSNTIKASFLNMGRLVFEAYVSDELSTVKQKQTQFEEASQNFTDAYKALASTVKNDPKLSAALQNVNGISQEYLATVNGLYTSHNSYPPQRC